MDFQAGEDVGLGLFGRQGTSVFSVGVRFAQFTSNMQSNLKARPDFAQVELHVPTPGHPNNHGTLDGHHYHQYIATAVSDRSFSGIGPSLSWNASAPVLGSTESGQLSLDWGANAALLFGRQKARVQHQTTAQYFASAFAYDKYPAPAGAGYHHPLVTRQRAHTLVVPNAEGLRAFPITLRTLGSLSVIEVISFLAQWIPASTRRRNPQLDSTGRLPQSASVSGVREKSNKRCLLCAIAHSIPQLSGDSNTPSSF